MELIKQSNAKIGRKKEVSRQESGGQEEKEWKGTKCVLEGETKAVVAKFLALEHMTWKRSRRQQTGPLLRQTIPTVRTVQLVPSPFLELKRPGRDIEITPLEGLEGE